MEKDDELDERAPWDEVTALDFNEDLDIGDRAKVIIDFLGACKEKNFSDFKKYIDTDQVFEEEGKYDFFKYVMSLVDGEYLKEVIHLEVRKGICNGCSCGATTYEFYADEDFAFAFNFPEKEGLPFGIKECWKSSGDDRFAEDHEHRKDTRQ